MAQCSNQFSGLHDGDEPLPAACPLGVRFLTDLLQKSSYNMHDTGVEIASVVNLPSSIPPPLLQDPEYVWTSQAAGAQLWDCDKQQVDYAWEQQSQQQSVVSIRNIEGSPSRYIDYQVDHEQDILSMWDIDMGLDEQLEMQSPERISMGHLLRSNSSSDFSAFENLSFADLDLPSILPEDTLNFESWIDTSESSKWAAEESMDTGSFLVNDDSSCYFTADDVSSKFYQSTRLGQAQPTRVPVAAGDVPFSTAMNDEKDCSGFKTNETKLSVSREHQAPIATTHDPHQSWTSTIFYCPTGTPQLRPKDNELSCELYPDTKISPTPGYGNAQILHPFSRLQETVSMMQPNPLETSYHYLEEQMNSKLIIDSDKKMWQQSTTSSPGASSLLRGHMVPAEAAGSTYHALITQMAESQEVDRMILETSNTRAKLGAAANSLTQNAASFPEISDGLMRSDNIVQLEPKLNLNNPMISETQNVGEMRTVQLLVACAEAIACRDSRQAVVLLQQLRSQMGTSSHGKSFRCRESIQRVVSCFMEGLVARLPLTCNFQMPQSFIDKSLQFPTPRQPPSEMEKQDGFNLVCKVSPYVAFGHLVANLAILEAFEGEDAVHVVDLGMTHELQWPHLIYALANRPGGPPKLLRITGFGEMTQKMEEAGHKLVKFASFQNVNFEFKVVTEYLENIERSSSMLQLQEGEALAVNSLLQLHCVVKESRGSLNAVLQSIHKLTPKILTLVEQDVNHNGPFFLGRFMEALDYYSAIFDSLDTVLPRYCSQRVKVEQFHFAEEIKNIISCEGPARVERHERVDQWRRRMSRAKFQLVPLPVKFLNQARVWLRVYSCDSYTLSEEKGCLVLGWKGRPVIAASSWRCN